LPPPDGAHPAHHICGMTNRTDSLHFERIAVFEERDARPITWRVEAYDSDGGVDVNIFSGNDAKERAIEYAAWKYGYTHGT
jgi:hypothetical protein